MRLALFIFLLWSAPASAYFQMELMKGKKMNKQATQWTLADWMSQRGRVRLMDHWLAMHTAGSWFEFNPGGGYNRIRFKNKDSLGATATVVHDAQKYHLDMYLSILNLYGEYELAKNEIETVAGAAGLRLLGSSSQTTNLVARYGRMKRHNFVSHEIWENHFAEGQLQIYVFRFMGVQGKYRHFFPRESNLGSTLEGHRITAGGFIEFSIFRLYADYYREPTEATTNGTVTEEEREGVEGGLRMHF